MTLPVRKRKSYQEQESRMSELARKVMRKELKRLNRCIRAKSIK